MTAEKKQKPPRLGPQQQKILKEVSGSVRLCVQYGRTSKDKFYYTDGTAPNEDAVRRLIDQGYFTPEADGLLPCMGQTLRLSAKGQQALQELQ